MTTLVVGASGATGVLLVEQLLARGESVRIIVRSSDKLPAALKQDQNLSIITASILDLNVSELAELVVDCDAVVSCLGHNLTFKGLFGAPYRLVTDATQRLCDAIKTTQRLAPARFVLMNTAGNSNRDLNEPISFGQQCVISLLRLLLPPHVDNEKASDYLRTQIGADHKSIEWAVVRPDNLTNDKQLTAFSVYPSPIRSAIFDAGTTSRLNVARFMADLITCDQTWENWKGQMPVIYNSEPEVSVATPC